MKRNAIAGALIIVMFAAPVWAEPYQDAIHGLMRASYRHMDLAYACRDLVGISRYREARVAAENAARATGMPTDVAMSAVDKMAAHIHATPGKGSHPGLNDCSTGLMRTKREVLAWRAKLRGSQQ
jgi:hypothetical protein